MASLSEATDMVLWEVYDERHSQNLKWGIQDHTPHEWLAILMEEVGEVARPVADARIGDFRVDEYRAELIQVAAVAVAAVEAHDRLARFVANFNGEEVVPSDVHQPPLQPNADEFLAALGTRTASPEVLAIAREQEGRVGRR